MASTKSYVNITNKYERVVVLVDMDCFYCQVEEKLDPSLKGKPIAVVQYNPWRGGGIIAVNYPAREKGVTRHMRGDEAKEQCPDIVLAKVPNVREKADLTKYREAGKDVARILQQFTPLLERASIDEAYLDITEEVVKRLETMKHGRFQLQPSQLNNTFAVGYESVGDYIQEISGHIESDTDDFDCNDEDLHAVKKSDLKLLCGAAIVNEIRLEVKKQTGFDCSAGIAHNKILAKLACGINKPNKQTILPLRQIQPMFSTLPVGKIKGLGGKFGEDLCEMLHIKYLGDLVSFSEAELQRRFDEKNGTWLYLIARGIDLECVTPRFYSKSIGCCKKFPGRNAITGLPTLEHWCSELANEISDRMEKDLIENNRKAKQMVVSYIQELQGQDVSSSRSIPLPSYDPEAIAKCAFDVLRRNTEVFFKAGSDHVLNNPLKFLGISVGKFEAIESNKNTIEKMFLNHCKRKENEVTAEQNEGSSKEKILEEKPEKKSFFASYLKKNLGTSKDETPDKDVDAACADLSNSVRTDAAPREIKSFFLNAIKRKSSESTAQIDENESNKAEAPLTTSVALEPEISSTSLAISCAQTSFLSSAPSTSHSEPSASSSYTHTYAEFGVPEPTKEDFTTCDKCGKKVLVYEIETHHDFHYAFELSQAQRDQFRSQVKAKVVTTPPNKKLKIGSSQANSKKTISCSQPITKFLPKEGPSSTITSGEGDQPLERCSECQALIAADKMLVHVDFHTASKIQREWSKQLMEDEAQRKLVNGPVVLSVRSNSAKSVGANKEATLKTKNIKAFFATQT